MFNAMKDNKLEKRLTRVSLKAFLGDVSGVDSQVGLA